MPTDEQILSSTHLRAMTSLAPEALRAAAARAQQAGKRTMSNQIKVKAENERGIDYSIRGPGGLVEQLSFTLMWDAGAPGERTAVVTKVHNLVTVRSKMFGISYGQRRIPALKSYVQFVEWMQKELAG